MNEHSIAPSVFIGHGNPLNAIVENDYTQAWSNLGSDVRQQNGTPKAILVVSAHWYIPETNVCAVHKPKTIHDFQGFSDELFAVQYPAPGAPELAKEIVDRLSNIPVPLDMQWGLDHGAWAVLCHIFKEADVPVLQLSIDSSKSASFHYQIGQSLAALRQEGVMILGSGNVVHNLSTYSWKEKSIVPYEWAKRFNDFVKNALANGDHQSLIDYLDQDQDARLSAPTPEHYLPLLYVIGATSEDEKPEVLTDVIEGGSISMTSFRFG